MASEKQIQANRLNALKGGVKTEEGKAAVRSNALSHGFFCNEVLERLQSGRARKTISIHPAVEVDRSGENVAPD